MDPSGRALDPLMPRYDLGAADAAHLVAYLETLGAADDPGVDATTIRFATVVTPGADPAQRKAMLDVIAAYVRWKNAATRGLQAHPGSSPGYRDEEARGYREWAIDVWELTGPPAGWEEQLRARARERPVFALIGGVGGVGGAGGMGDPWWPIHRFCEEAEIPCLFPATELPVTSPLGDYSFYLSSGPEGEAKCLARYLRDGPDAGAPVVQVYRAAGIREPAGVDAQRRGVRHRPRGVGLQRRRSERWRDGGGRRSTRVGRRSTAAGGMRRARPSGLESRLQRSAGSWARRVAVTDLRLPAEGAVSASLWQGLAAVSGAGPIAGGETAPDPAPVVVLWLSGLGSPGPRSGGGAGGSPPAPLPLLLAWRATRRPTSPPPSASASVSSTHTPCRSSSRPASTGCEPGCAPAAFLPATSGSSSTPTSRSPSPTTPSLTSSSASTATTSSSRSSTRSRTPSTRASIRTSASARASASPPRAATSCARPRKAGSEPESGWIVP